MVYYKADSIPLPPIVVSFQQLIEIEQKGKIPPSVWLMQHGMFKYIELRFGRKYKFCEYCGLVVKTNSPLMYSNNPSYELTESIAKLLSNNISKLESMIFTL